MAARVELAGAHQVDGLWPLVSDGLEDACRQTGGDMSADQLWTECRSGRAFLIVISDEAVIGASVWRFERWSSGKKLRCLALYGSGMGEWLPAHRTMVEDMARVGGAKALVADGRRGWERVFPKATVLRQTYELELP